MAHCLQTKSSFIIFLHTILVRAMKNVDFYFFKQRVYSIRLKLKSKNHRSSMKLNRFTKFSIYERLSLLFQTLTSWSKSYYFFQAFKHFLLSYLHQLTVLKNPTKPIIQIAFRTTLLLLHLRVLDFDINEPLESICFMQQYSILL